MARVINLAHLQQFAAVNLLSDPGAIGGPVVIPSVVRVGYVWNLTNGKQGRHFMYGRYSGTNPSSGTLAQALKTAAVAGSSWSTMAAFMPSTGGLSTVTVQDLSVAFQPVFSSTATLSPGTSASPALPDEVAIVISLTTNLSGRANRGRNYIPNWATNALGTGGQIATGATNALEGWFDNNVFGALNAQGLVPVIGQQARQAYTGSTGTQHPARAAGSVPIALSNVRNATWDTQRRRGLR